MELNLKNNILSAVDKPIIGYEGENITDTLIIHCDTLSGDFLYLLDIDNGTQGKYQAALTPDYDSLTLSAPLSAGIIGNRGEHRWQIVMIRDDVAIDKSSVLSVFTRSSVNALDSVEEFIPSEFEAFLAQISGLSADAKDSADEAATHAETAETAAEAAKKAVSSGGYIYFEEENGRLIMYKENADDIDFSIDSDGHLEVIIDGN